MRKPVVLAWTRTMDGITVRTWQVLGLPFYLSFSRVLQSKEAYYGPVPRLPGLWRRVVRAVIQGTGRSAVYYCPALPPLRTGIEVSLPRVAFVLDCRPRRHEEVLKEHFRQPCPACAAGWPADGRLVAEPAT